MDGAIRRCQALANELWDDGKGIERKSHSLFSSLCSGSSLTSVFLLRWNENCRFALAFPRYTGDSLKNSSAKMG